MDEGSRKAETEIELALRWQGGDAGLSCRSWSPDRSPTKRDAAKGVLGEALRVNTGLRQRLGWRKA